MRIAARSPADPLRGSVSPRPRLAWIVALAGCAAPALPRTRAAAPPAAVAPAAVASPALAAADPPLPAPYAPADVPVEQLQPVRELRLPVAVRRYHVGVIAQADGGFVLHAPGWLARFDRSAAVTWQRAHRPAAAEIREAGSTATQVGDLLVQLGRRLRRANRRGAVAPADPRAHRSDGPPRRGRPTGASAPRGSSATTPPWCSPSPGPCASRASTAVTARSGPSTSSALLARTARCAGGSATTSSTRSPRRAPSPGRPCPSSGVDEVDVATGGVRARTPLAAVPRDDLRAEGDVFASREVAFDRRDGRVRWRWSGLRTLAPVDGGRACVGVSLSHRVALFARVPRPPPPEEDVTLVGRVEGWREADRSDFSTAEPEGLTIAPDGSFRAALRARGELLVRVCCGWHAAVVRLRGAGRYVTTLRPID
jgi:hypothetical protein